MPYAKIVVGLPVDGPFDYSIPENLIKMVSPGKRAWVTFGPKKLVGYIVGLAKESRIKNIKPVLDVIDEAPLLNKDLLTLTEDLSRYYCCSWGEAIESAIPQALRKGKKVSGVVYAQKKGVFEPSLLIRADRLNYYIEEIKTILNKNMSVLLILPDKQQVLDLKQVIEDKLKVSPVLLFRNEPKEADEWLSAACGKAKLVIGTRSAVFAPLSNLGLIILDDEGDQVYKQEQAPHYHAREVVLMRAKISGCKVVLGSSAPSLESYYLAKKEKIDCLFESAAVRPKELKVIDMKREFYRAKSERPAFSRYLADSITSALIAKEKILIYLNRKGFATIAFCHNCAKPLVCPRCNTNLIYFYESNTLACGHCNFKMEVPKICPQCNSGYIKFKGTGTEKIESELSRIFPQAKIKKVSDAAGFDLASADIFVATSAVFKLKEAKFGLVGVLNIDSALNRLDLRSAEKAFATLNSLVLLAGNKLIIQTGSASHHLFEAIIKNDPQIFYDNELKERKQLGYPPYKHIVLIKLRSQYPEKVKIAAAALFEKLGKAKEKGVEALSVNPSNPPKLRGSFYWQITLKAASPEKAGKFIKLNLKNFRHSGIIVTVDVDPI